MRHEPWWDEQDVMDCYDPETFAEFLAHGEATLYTKQVSI